MDFADVVKTRMDDTMAAAGLPFNSNSTDGTIVSVLYEGTAKSFLDRYPGLDPTWDEAWHEDPLCVDLWIKYDSTNDTIDLNLEHWGADQLAERYGDTLWTERALTGPGDLETRVSVLASLVETSLAIARTEPRPSRPTQPETGSSDAPDR